MIEPQPEAVVDGGVPVAPAPETRTTRIGRNMAINLAGTIFPLLLSLATVPAYLHLVGEERYGVLAVVWVVLGYFGVFDLGLSRATANQIARMRDSSPAERERVFWTALCVNASVGVVGGVILYLVGEVLLGHVLKVSPGLHAEALGALPWLGVAVPLTTMSLVLAGALEGRESFATVNLLTSIGLAMFQLAPLAYAYWVGPDLRGLIMSATIALFASTILSMVVLAVVLPLRQRPRVDVERLGLLLRYGGWVTLTGLISPILTAVDRVLIGSVLGATAVTRYTIPFALVSRVQVLSSSLARTTFPRFSRLDSDDAAYVSRQSLIALTAVMTVLTVIGAVTLEPFLRIWIGGSLATHSAPIGEILLIGVWINSLAVIPYAFLQARGRPDLPAKFHVLEVAPYIGGLVLALHLGGVRGAAWAWTGRAAVDAVLLFWAARRVSSDSDPGDSRQVARGAVLTVIAAVASLTIFQHLSLRLGVGGALVLLSLAWAWRIAPAPMRLRILRQRTT